MITRLGMAPRRPDIPMAAALEHWRTSHADAAGRIPGLRRYDQLHPELVDGSYAFGYPGFDVCSELDFDSVETMDAGFASEAYQEAVRADEDAFVDKRRFSLMLGRWQHLTREPEAAQVSLLRFLRVHPAADPAQLWDAIRGPYLDRIDGDVRIVGARVLRPLTSQRLGREQPACDLVVALGFKDSPTALAWTRSDVAMAAELTCAGLAFGSVSHLVRPTRVVG